MKITSQNKLLLPVFCSAFLLSGCWLDSDDDKAVEPVELATSANVRVVHASPDAPTVDIIIGGTPISQKLDLDYQDATAWYAIAPNTYEISVEANLPSNSR
jgi:hypothetical protein